MSGLTAWNLTFPSACCGSNSEVPSRRIRLACIAHLAAASMIPLGYQATASDGPVSTTSVLPVPVHEGWVNDTADILKAAEKQHLSDQLAS